MAKTPTQLRSEAACKTVLKNLEWQASKWYQKKILLVEYNDYIYPNCKMEHKIKESNKEIVAFCKSCGHPIWAICIKN